MAMLHGFTQNLRCWGRFADLLAEHFRLVLVDAPGHGASGHDDADLPTAARLLGETAGRCCYLGYSMGARICLRLALDRPDLVERLVLISASPGIEDDSAREARRISDERLARDLEQTSLDVFLRRWLANPLFAGLDEETSLFEQRLANRPDGLARSLLACGQGAHPSMWPELGELRCPVLLVAGGRDTKYVRLARRIADALGGRATVAIVPGTSHAPHLQQPEQVAETVVRWIERTS